MPRPSESFPGRHGRESGKAELPRGFKHIHDIQEEVSVRPGEFVNVVGLVKDVQLPISTRGSDYKCTLKLFDLSSEDDSDGIPLIIFRPLATMPEVGSGDVVLLLQVKTQRFQSDRLSLITNFQTAMHVYDASKIPRYPIPARKALKPKKDKGREPNDAEHTYVSYLYHKADKDGLDSERFQERARASLNVKDKFTLLENVRDGMFVDLIGRVARDPYDQMDKTTVWVSDYTKNDTFFNHEFTDVDRIGGDPYGYTSHGDSSSKNWVGPYGKQAIQVTCYEPHASRIRDESIVAGTWVSLRNVQIKYGNNMANLEGFMREDRGARDKITVEILDPEADSPSERFKAAVRRCRDYEKEKKAQLKALKKAQSAGAQRRATMGLPPVASKKRKSAPDAQTSNPKRRRQSADSRKPVSNQSEKSDSAPESESEPELAPSPKQSYKEKRRAERAEAVRRKDEEAQARLARKLNLNQSITCESNETRPKSLAAVKEPTMFELRLDSGQMVQVPLPFNNFKHLVHVRVVDFEPSNLADFAVGKRKPAYPMLDDDADNAGESSSGSSSSEDDDPDGLKRAWQWQFRLQLEDATTSQSGKKDAAEPERLWVTVGNHDAQCLLLADPCDLREDPEQLALLRERMFHLWGELEEHKTRDAAEKRKKLLGDAKLADQPPPSSDELAERTRVSNKPFACCIKEYGVKVREDDEAKADALNGKRWQRMFGLFGTKISSM